MGQEGEGAEGRKGRDKSYLGSVTVGGDLMLSSRFPEDALSLVSTPLPSVQGKVREAWLGERRQKSCLPL